MRDYVDILKLFFYLCYFWRLCGVIRMYGVSGEEWIGMEFGDEENSAVSSLHITNVEDARRLLEEEAERKRLKKEKKALHKARSFFLAWGLWLQDWHMLLVALVFVVCCLLLIVVC